MPSHTAAEQVLGLAQRGGAPTPGLVPPGLPPGQGQGQPPIAPPAPPSIGGDLGIQPGAIQPQAQPQSAVAALSPEQAQIVQLVLSDPLIIPALAEIMASAPQVQEGLGAAGIGAAPAPPAPAQALFGGGGI